MKMLKLHIAVIEPSQYMSSQTNVYNECYCSTKNRCTVLHISWNRRIPAQTNFVHNCFLF